MSDLVLFRIRNRPFLSFSFFYHRTLLFLFALFLLTGNFFRFFPLPPFPSNLSVVELLLYVLAFPLFLSRIRKSQLVVLGVILSTLYGICLHGFDAASVLYSCKLVAMIAAGIAIGESLFKYFSIEISQGIGFFLKLFFLIFLLSAAIFFAFPKAHLFFLFLQRYGIHFTGDPHQRRLISTFFDPNYYGAIACIPLLLAWTQRKYTLFFLFLISILFTFSRSGVATCALMLLLMGVSRFIERKTPFFQLKHLPFLFSLFFLPIFSLILYSEEVFHFLSRFLHLREDPSALARLDTFQLGLSYFLRYPFFGTGYHYLSFMFLHDFHRLSPDSSPLVTLVNFGCIPCLAFLFAGIVWSVQKFKTLHRAVRPLFLWLYIYVSICILFTSHFNNLLYYQFWLIPMIALFTYIQEVSHEMRSRT